MVACQKEIMVGSQRRRHAVGGFTLIEAAYAAGMSVPPHYHERSNITIVLQGGLQERAGRSDRHCGPGSVVVKPAGTVHSNRFAPHGARTFIVELPKACARATAEHLDSTAQSLSYAWRDDGAVVGAMLRVLEACRALGQSHAADTATGGEIAEDLCLLLSHVGQARENAPKASPAWLDAVRQYLHDTATVGFSVSDAARTAGVHPVYLARVFRRCHGLSMHEFVHRLRVRRAADRLAGSTAPLFEIAVSLGFADQAHFCRVFKAHIGTTPGQFRRIARG